MDISVILASILFLIVGLALGFFVRNKQALADVKEREEKGDQIIEKAKVYAKDSNTSSTRTPPMPMEFVYR